MKFNKNTVILIWYFSIQFFSFIFSFLFSIFFTRIFSAIEYGDYSTFLTLSGFFSICITFSFNTVYQSGIKKFNNTITDFSNFLITVEILKSFFFSLVFLLLLIFLNFKSEDLIFVSIINSFFTSFILVIISKLTYDIRYVLRSVIVLLIPLLPNLISLVFYYLFNSSNVFEIRILPTLFSNFLIFIFLVLLFFPKIQNFKFDKSFMTFTLYSSFFGTLHSFVTYLLSSIEKIFFILSNKIASLGVYSITLSIAIVLDIFTIVLDSYWGPQITKLLHLNDHTLINRKIYFYSIYFFIIVLSFLLLFPVLLSFFPNEYKVENFNYVMLSFSSYFLFLYKLKLPILYYEGLNKIISKYSFFILFIITPIGYFLIQYYEITGAVITHLILNMLRFLVVEFFLFKNYRQLSFDFKKLILPTLLIFIILLTESNQIFIILSVFIYILFYTKYFIKIKFKLL